MTRQISAEIKTNFPICESSAGTFNIKGINLTPDASTPQLLQFVRDLNTRQSIYPYSDPPDAILPSQAIISKEPPKKYQWLPTPTESIVLDDLDTETDALDTKIKALLRKLQRKISVEELKELRELLEKQLSEENEKNESMTELEAKLAAAFKEWEQNAKEGQK